MPEVAMKRSIQSAKFLAMPGERERSS